MRHNNPTDSLSAELEDVTRLGPQIRLPASLPPQEPASRDLSALPSHPEVATLAAFDTMKNRYWISRASRLSRHAQHPSQADLLEQVQQLLAKVPEASIPGAALLSDLSSLNFDRAPEEINAGAEQIVRPSYSPVAEPDSFTMHRQTSQSGCFVI